MTFPIVSTLAALQIPLGSETNITSYICLSLGWQRLITAFNVDFEVGRKQEYPENKTTTITNKQTKTPIIDVTEATNQICYYWQAALVKCQAPSTYVQVV